MDNRDFEIIIVNNKMSIIVNIWVLVLLVLVEKLLLSVFNISFKIIDINKIVVLSVRYYLLIDFNLYFNNFLNILIFFIF